jgi:pimeloyl-ACP methyl ester carboxylesterase
MSLLAGHFFNILFEGLEGWMVISTFPGDGKFKDEGGIWTAEEIAEHTGLPLGTEFFLTSDSFTTAPGGTVEVPGPDGPRSVEVGPVWIARTELTWEAYDVFALELDRPEPGSDADAIARPSRPYGAPDYGWGREGFPVISVSQAAAEAFGEWLSTAFSRHVDQVPREAFIPPGADAEEARRMRGLEAFRGRLALNRADYGAKLRALDLPVLCLVGDASEKSFRMMKALADTLPNARLELIENAFEPSNLTQADAFNGLVGEFLESLGWTAKGQAA